MKRTAAMAQQERLLRQVNDWNDQYPVGTEVVLLTDTKGPVFTRTTTPAQMLSEHTAVIWLEGFRGCYDLDRVKPRASLSEAEGATK